MDALENYIKDLEEGKNPNPNAGKIEKKEMVRAQQEMKQRMDDFTFDSEDEGPFKDDFSEVGFWILLIDLPVSCKTRPIWKHSGVI